MAKNDDKRIIEIVVKATGDADLKRLARELAVMRKEAQATRKEVQQTNETLSGFGKTFGTVAKAFAGGLALKNLVQSSEVVQDLTKNVRDLSGAFIDAVSEASGLTGTLGDEQFWRVAVQGAKDLGHEIGEWVDALNKLPRGDRGGGPSLVDMALSAVPGGLRARQDLNKYSESVRLPLEFDTEALQKLTREASRTLERQLDRFNDNALDAFGAALRSDFEQRVESEGAADLARWLAQNRAQQGARIDRNLEGRLRNFALEIDETFEVVKVDIEEAAETMTRLTDEGERFQRNAEWIARTTHSWTEALDNAVEYMQLLQDLQGDLTNQAIAWGEALTYSFKGVLTEELHNTRDVLHSITNEMRDFYAELAARAAAQEALGWIRSVIGWASGLSTSTFSMSPQAKGNAFAAGQVVPFAHGGVVTRPTVFPMARGLGLMGEAGPEAVMPLKRGADGKLGVAAGRSNVVIENHGQPVTASVISSEEETRIVLRAATMGAEIAQAQMNKSVSSGYGATAQSFQRAYGLRRRV